MRTLRTLRGVDVKGKRVLLRVDCNVAVDDDGRPLSGAEQRLEAILPTIQHLQSEGARVILLSHLGRPGGKVVESLRLDDVARQLSVLLNTPVRYIPEVGGPDVCARVEQMQDGDIALLENLRFDPGEERADLAFADALASLGDLVVQDAFSVSHRSHASVAVLPRLRPSYAGFLVEREVDVLQRILVNPERPAIAIIGGAKLETKLALLKTLLPRVDHLLTGGGVANTFLRLSGSPIGTGLVETHPFPDVSALLSESLDKLHLPTDVHVIRGGQSRDARIIPVGALTPADDVRDIGPETALAYCRVIATSKTCIWNGPLGQFETLPFGEGTRRVAHCIRNADAFSVVGGGDTVRALSEMGLLSAFDHVSTGGGAMLAFLEGAPMPGLEPLYTPLETA
ncbi:MAG: phosphoglycerate kinase [Parcubacteria group bacterium Gr01-1014_38]|nr:MAG: phosphoglycerate kinase [Parcubacteria group bacterium Gr01-1014_38]